MLISLIIFLNEINNFFCIVNIDFFYKFIYFVVILELCKIFVLIVFCVIESLFKLKRIVLGLDGILYWIWKEFVYDFVFVVIYIFYCFLENYIVFDLWKFVDIIFLFKEFSFNNCILLWFILLINVIMRVFECFVYI